MVHLTRFFGLFSFFLGVILGFQNCAPGPMDEGATDGSSELPGDGGIAYEITVDHVGFLSCSFVPEPYARDSMFTFKVAAMDKTKSGLGLSSAFYNSLANTAPDTVLQGLQNSPINKETQVQFAYRPIGATGIDTTISANGQASDERDLVTTELSNMTELAYLKPGEKTNFNGGLWAAVGFASLDTTALMNGLRNVNANAVIALTFSDGLGGTSAARKGSVGPYGTGIQMINTCANTQCKSDRISSVREVNLSTVSSTGTSWACPATEAYIVIRRGDEAASGCTFAIPAPGSADYASYTRAKNFLGPKWDVDVFRKCVRPSSSNAYTCYSGSAGVEYDVSKLCENNAGAKYCVKHFSLCYRN